MRVFNLTDVETPELKAAGMVRQTLVLGGAIVGPGCCADVADNAMTRMLATRAVMDGLLSVGVLPPRYAMLKSQLQRARRLPPIPAQAPAKRPPRIWNTKKRKVG